MAKNRLSRDQKRKAKLKKRSERSRKQESLAYSGGKYRTEEYVSVIYRTEVGIYESYVLSDRGLTDDDVEGAIEHLVLRMREGPLSASAEPDADGDEESLIIANIRRNWRTLEEKGELPGRDDLIGVLRTILHSIEIWRSKSLHAQGYLRYIEGFLKNLGVSVRKLTVDPKELPEAE